MQPAISDEIIELEIRKAVEFLSHLPGVRRVWLFGSAAKGRGLDWRSDLDFAVEGMASTEQYRAWSELDAQMKIPVDLVLVEAANPVLRDEILRWGRVIYEADPPQIATLSAMIARDLEAIERLDGELTPLSSGLDVPVPAFRDLAAIAYILHNIYGALENIFEQVSRTFENHVTDPAQWHRELLTKMFLEIPKIRPAVLPADLRGFLNDLRGFRHVFRHAYEFELDAEKLKMLVRDWNRDRTSLLSALSRFRDNLLREI